jgi:hypothetical protein
MSERCRLQLFITEALVKQRLQLLWDGMCADLFGAPVDPRLIPDDTPITYSRYCSWIINDDPKPPHLHTFIPTNMKYASIRLRCTSFPLAIQAERVGKNHKPRSQRLCKLCNHACVEDEKHFLMEFPPYSKLRILHPSILRPDSTVSSILNFPDQKLLGQALLSFLALRKATI